ncbi:MAG: hypothetical protein V3U26_02615, partial [Dehalococcoidia bacterium]
AVLTSRIASAGFRRAILLGLIGAILTGFMMAYAVTNTNLGSQSLKLGRETFSDDTDVVIAAKRIFKLKNADAGPAVGDSAPGLEVVDTLPQINNALVRNNYAYEFEVKEAAVTSWQSGENFKIEVYMDDGSTTSLLATLYTQQGSVDDATVEGVTVTVDTGQTTIVGDSFSMVVSRQ